MISSLHKKKLLHMLLAPCLLFAATLWITGCGSEEEAPAPDAPATAPADENVATMAPAKADGPPLADVVPVTLPALRYMPAEAQVAVALPSLPAVRDKVMPLAKALAEPGEDLETALKHLMYDAADEVGVRADSYEDLAIALGVDPNAPVAAFADFRKMVESAAEAKAKYDAILAEEMAAEAAAAAEKAGDAPEGSEPSLEEQEDEPVYTPNYMERAEEPEWIVVLGVTDPAKARAEIERIAEADRNLSAFPSTTEEVDGVTITIRDVYGYFVTDTHIVFGHLDLIRGAAKRVKAPATFRYGTVECPPGVADEAVVLVYGGRFMPLLETAIPLMGVDEGLSTMFDVQMATYKAMLTEGGEDPAVFTVAMDENHLELTSSMDSTTHPSLMALAGPASPLRLARYLPENTLALLSLRFNDEFKNQLTKDVLPAVSASGNPEIAGAMGIATQVVTQIGDELTIGITGANTDLPGVYAMIGLAQPDTTQNLLQMFLPMQGGQEYEGYTVNMIPVNPAMNVYMSIVDDFLLACNNESGIKAVIDLHKAQQASGLFASLDPPMDISKPVYQTFVFNTKIVDEFFNAVSMFPGAVVEQDPGMSRMVRAIREVRSVKEMENNWLTGRLNVQFNDLEAAAAASAIAAEETEAPVADDAPVTEATPAP